MKDDATVLRNIRRLITIRYALMGVATVLALTAMSMNLAADATGPRVIGLVIAAGVVLLVSLLLPLLALRDARRMHYRFHDLLTEDL